jgi:tRNA (mo5U34)-methyltransferase
LATRSVRWRGFALDVSVPERLVSRLRSRSQTEQPQTGRVEFLEPTPSVTPKPRDTGEALRFRDVAEEKGREQATILPLTGNDKLTTRVNSTTWYHTIELPGGIRTPGQFDHRSVLPRYGLPADLSGKTALDVATFNGYWAFEMERRGADVTAIDLDDPREWDYPNPVRPHLTFTSKDDIGAGFRIAHEALNSSVKRVMCSVYDLSPERVGSFDFVHCGDLLLHLREPLRALEAIRSVTTGELLLSEGIDAHAPRGNYGPTTQYMGGWDDLLWWVPSLDTLAQMVIDAGFRSVQVNSVFNIAKTYESDGFWRASLTAEA